MSKHHLATLQFSEGLIFYNNFFLWNHINYRFDFLVFLMKFILYFGNFKNFLHYPILFRDKYAFNENFFGLKEVLFILKMFVNRLSRRISNSNNYDYQYFYLNLPHFDLYWWTPKHNNTEIFLPHNLIECYFENSNYFWNYFERSFVNYAYFRMILNQN